MNKSDLGSGTRDSNTRTDNGNVRAALVAALAIFGIACSDMVQAGGDGKTLFNYYRCAGCHGDDGRGTALHPEARQIAGMNSVAVIRTVHRLIAEGGHEDYVDNGGCGEAPNTSQIQAIAEYVAALPK